MPNSYLIGRTFGTFVENKNDICVAYNPLTTAYDFCINGLIKTINMKVFTVDFNTYQDTVPYVQLIEKYNDSNIKHVGIVKKETVKVLPKTLEDLLLDIHTIYIDMDDVLVNFKKMLKDCNPSYDVDRMYDVAQIFGKKEALVHEWLSNVVKEQGFATAEPLGFFKVVMNELLPYWESKGITVEILSSLTSNPDFQQAIGTQKFRWLQNQNCTLKFHFVKGAKNKQTYAKPGCLLIDDYQRNVSQFISAGGYAILADPENQESIIEKLRLLGLTPN